MLQCIKKSYSYIVIDMSCTIFIFTIYNYDLNIYIFFLIQYFSQFKVIVVLVHLCALPDVKKVLFLTKWLGRQKTDKAQCEV